MLSLRCNTTSKKLPKTDLSICDMLNRPRSDWSGLEFRSCGQTCFSESELEVKVHHWLYNA